MKTRSPEHAQFIAEIKSLKISETRNSALDQLKAAVGAGKLAAQLGAESELIDQLALIDVLRERLTDKKNKIKGSLTVQDTSILRNPNHSKASLKEKAFPYFLHPEKSRKGLAEDLVAAVDEQADFIKAVDAADKAVNKKESKSLLRRVTDEILARDPGVWSLSNFSQFLVFLMADALIQLNALLEAPAYQHLCENGEYSDQIREIRQVTENLAKFLSIKDAVVAEQSYKTVKLFFQHAASKRSMLSGRSLLPKKIAQSTSAANFERTASIPAEGVASADIQPPVSVTPPPKISVFPMPAYLAKSFQNHLANAIKKYANKIKIWASDKKTWMTRAVTHIETLPLQSSLYDLYQIKIDDGQGTSKTILKILTEQRSGKGDEANAFGETLKEATENFLAGNPFSLVLPYIALTQFAAVAEFDAQTQKAYAAHLQNAVTEISELRRIMSNIYSADLSLSATAAAADMERLVTLAKNYPEIEIHVRLLLVNCLEKLDTQRFTDLSRYVKSWLAKGEYVSKDDLVKVVVKKLKKTCMASEVNIRLYEKALLEVASLDPKAHKNKDQNYVERVVLDLGSCIDKHFKTKALSKEERVMDLSLFDINNEIKIFESANTAASKTRLSLMENLTSSQQALLGTNVNVGSITAMTLVRVNSSDNEALKEFATTVIKAAEATQSPELQVNAWILHSITNDGDVDGYGKYILDSLDNAMHNETQQDKNGAEEVVIDNFQKRKFHYGALLNFARVLSQHLRDVPSSDQENKNLTKLVQAVFDYMNYMIDVTLRYEYQFLMEEADSKSIRISADLVLKNKEKDLGRLKNNIQALKGSFKTILCPVKKDESGRPGARDRMAAIREAIYGEDEKSTNPNIGFYALPCFSYHDSEVNLRVLAGKVLVALAKFMGEKEINSALVVKQANVCRLEDALKFLIKNPGIISTEESEAIRILLGIRDQLTVEARENLEALHIRAERDVILVTQKHIVSEPTQFLGKNFLGATAPVAAPFQSASSSSSSSSSATVVSAISTPARKGVFGGVKATVARDADQATVAAAIAAEEELFDSAEKVVVDHEVHINVDGHSHEISSPLQRVAKDGGFARDGSQADQATTGQSEQLNAETSSSTFPAPVPVAPAQEVNKRRVAEVVEAKSVTEGWLLDAPTSKNTPKKTSNLVGELTQLEINEQRNSLRDAGGKLLGFYTIRRRMLINKEADLCEEHIQTNRTQRNTIDQERDQFIEQLENNNESRLRDYFIWTLAENAVMAEDYDPQGCYMLDYLRNRHEADWDVLLVSGLELYAAMSDADRADPETGVRLLKALIKISAPLMGVLGDSDRNGIKNLIAALRILVQELHPSFTPSEITKKVHSYIVNYLRGEKTSDHKVREIYNFMSGEKDQDRENTFDRIKHALGASENHDIGNFSTLRDKTTSRQYVAYRAIRMLENQQITKNDAIMLYQMLTLLKAAVKMEYNKESSMLELDLENSTPNSLETISEKSQGVLSKVHKRLANARFAALYEAVLSQGTRKVEDNSSSLDALIRHKPHKEINRDLREIEIIARQPYHWWASFDAKLGRNVYESRFAYEAHAAFELERLNYLTEFGIEEQALAFIAGEYWTKDKDKQAPDATSPFTEALRTMAQAYGCTVEDILKERLIKASDGLNAMLNPGDNIAEHEEKYGLALNENKLLKREIMDWVRGNKELEKVYVERTQETGIHSEEQANFVLSLPNVSQALLSQAFQWKHDCLQSDKDASQLEALRKQIDDHNLWQKYYAYIAEKETKGCADSLFNGLSATTLSHLIVLLDKLTKEFCESKEDLTNVMNYIITSFHNAFGALGSSKFLDTAKSIGLIEEASAVRFYRDVLDRCNNAFNGSLLFAPDFTGRVLRRAEEMRDSAWDAFDKNVPSCIEALLRTLAGQLGVEAKPGYRTQEERDRANALREATEVPLNLVTTEKSTATGSPASAATLEAQDLGTTVGHLGTPAAMYQAVSEISATDTPSSVPVPGGNN